MGSPHLWKPDDAFGGVARRERDALEFAGYRRGLGAAKRALERETPLAIGAIAVVGRLIRVLEQPDRARRLGFTDCGECGRTVHAGNEADQAGAGFIANCGRRLVSISQCVPGGCAAAKAARSEDLPLEGC